MSHPFLPLINIWNRYRCSHDDSSKRSCSTHQFHSLRRGRAQLTPGLGCTVIGTAGADAKRAAAKAAGCDHVVDYTLPDWPQQVKALTRDRGVDVVYDPVGLLIPSLKCVAWNARLLVVGFAGGTIEKIPANLVLLKNVSVVGVRGGEAARKDPERGKRTIKECFRMITEGMRPVIHGRVYEGLGELAEGLGDLENRKVTGKAVVRIRREEGGERAKL